MTNAATDPSIMHNRAICDSSIFLDVHDPGVYEVRLALDRIYRAEVLGKFTMKYKLEIVRYIIFCMQIKQYSFPFLYVQIL